MFGVTVYNLYLQNSHYSLQITDSNIKYYKWSFYKGVVTLERFYLAHICYYIKWLCGGNSVSLGDSYSSLWHFGYCAWCHANVQKSFKNVVRKNHCSADFLCLYILVGATD